MATKEKKKLTHEEALEKQLELMFNVPLINYEENHGKRITKSAGYIPLKTQIEMLQDAGERVEMQRNGLYDFQDEQIGFEHDPTRALNYDLADASEHQRKAQKELLRINRAKYLARLRQEATTPQKTVENDFTEVSIGDNINKEESPTEPKKTGGKK